MGGIKTKHQQISTEQQQHRKHHNRNQQGLMNICIGNTQHVAEQDVEEVDIAPHVRHQDESESEETGKDKADHGVFLDAGFLLDKADCGHRAHPEHKRP